MKERTTMERRVYYFERQIELGWLPFFFSFSANTAAAATVSNLDKNTSSEAASSAVGCGIRSRWLPIISETFLIAKVDSEREKGIQIVQTRSVVISCRLCGSLGLCDLLRVATVMTERERWARRASERQSQIHFAVFGPRNERSEGGRGLRRERGRAHFCVRFPNSSLCRTNREYQTAVLLPLRS